MGQRLVVEIFYKGERVANSYYHQSGFTNSAINRVSGILENYNEEDKEAMDKDPVLYAAKLFEASGAGICKEDSDYFRAKYPGEAFRVNRDRNEGLVSITEEEMEQSMGWCEGYAAIHIDSMVVNFDCIPAIDPDDKEPLFYESHADKALGRHFDEEDAEQDAFIQEWIRKLPETDTDMEAAVTFENWPVFAEEIKSLPYDFKSGGKVYSKIE